MRALWSGISRGTERLVFNGEVPPSEHQRMRCPHQTGDFPFPVKYGYCSVGVVEAGAPTYLGRTVFALHPHQDRYVLPLRSVTIVPAAVPARRAVLAANMETALNALWDGGAGPGDRITIVGGGVVGLLVAYLAAGLPGAEVTVVDTVDRSELAGAIGARFAAPGLQPPDADIVFHTSASGAGLATAIAAGGEEAVVVEVSWYGDRAVSAPLGGAFHSRRLTLRGSQVGQIARSRRPRWSYARRLGKVLELLADHRLDALLGEDLRFATLPDTLPAAFQPGATGLAPVIRYD